MAKKCGICKLTVRTNHLQYHHGGKYVAYYHIKCYQTKALTDLLSKNALISILSEMPSYQGHTVVTAEIKTYLIEKLQNKLDNGDFKPDNWTVDDYLNYAIEETISLELDIPRSENN